MNQPVNSVIPCKMRLNSPLVTSYLLAYFYMSPRIRQSVRVDKLKDVKRAQREMSAEFLTRKHNTVAF